MIAPPPMSVVERTDTWKRTLASQEGDDPIAEQSRTQLRRAFEDFRKYIAPLAAQIASDLRDFTVHDISHIDALWEMTDLVIGPDYELSPAEAFVLGGAFLVHDLGLALAADPRGIVALRENAQWPLALKAAYIKLYGKEPETQATAEEDDETVRIATTTLLRNLHAERAARIPLEEYRDDVDNQAFYLISDAELRTSYGELIGQIAFSHWWDLDRVQQEFPSVLGGPSTSPIDWRIDPLKLALILRVVDACHLDSRRAPMSVRIHQNPQGKSRLHWLFQQRLGKPYIAGKAIVFSSSVRFTAAESEAWWLCFDTLRQADREVSRSNAVLRDTNRKEFQIERVAGTEDPGRLEKYVQVHGWKPIDAQVHVGNVARLVTTLGGSALYGNNSVAPLRELIQNAADAVRAKRLQEGNDLPHGEIHISLARKTDGVWLSVEDDGLGMSERVIREILLDFGQSYWNSDLILAEHPELVAKGYQPTGKFGIGFFSVFMLGDRVEIVTRTSEDGIADTRVLIMNQGAESRPMLRPATVTEQRRQVGTRVSVRLHAEETITGLLGPGMIGDEDGHSFESSSVSLEQPWSLSDLCEWLCPCLDVDLYVTEFDKGKTIAVKANDWLSISSNEIIERIMLGSTSAVREYALTAVNRLRDVTLNDGQVVGRAAMVSEQYYHSTAIVTAGPFRANHMFQTIGVFLGTTSNAARNSAQSLISRAQLMEWFNDQRSLIEEEIKDTRERYEYAQVFRSYGLSVGQLPIARLDGEFLTYDEVVQWALTKATVAVSPPGEWAERKRHRPDDTLCDNVILTDFNENGLVHREEDQVFKVLLPKSTQKVWKQGCLSLQSVVWEAVAQAWEIQIDEMLANSEIALRPYRDENRVVLSSGGEGFYKVGGSLLKQPQTNL